MSNEGEYRKFLKILLKGQGVIDFYFVIQSSSHKIWLLWSTSTQRERERLVSFQKSPNHSNSNTTLRHSNTRSAPLKLIYIISSIYKAKIKCFEYFLPIHQAAWILYSNDGGLNLSGKDSTSNLFGRTEVYVCVRVDLQCTHIYIFKSNWRSREFACIYAVNGLLSRTCMCELFQGQTHLIDFPLVVINRECIHGNRILSTCIKKDCFSICFHNFVLLGIRS